MRPPRRFHELDSLRGLAALSVVFLHFTDLYLSPERTASFTHGEKLLLASLAPAYSGRSAVILFFVLSGFVLALPFCKGREQPYAPFVLRRVIRIYLPYLASLLFAAGGAYCFHGHLGMGAWADGIWSQPFSYKLLLQHLMFLGNYDTGQFNPVIWSLVVEMRMSLVFPLLVVAVLRIRAVWSIPAALAFAVLARVLPHFSNVHDLTVETLLSVPAFVAGILLAKHLEAAATWFSRRSQPVKWMLLAVSLCAYLTNSLGHGSYPIRILGSAGLLLFSLNSAMASRVLLQRVPLFLGRISYSLYLVHVSVLFALTFLLHRVLSQWLILPLYLTGALLLATVFHGLLEAPCIKLSRKLTSRSAKVLRA